jgi:osmotically-inducible protein OsmY
MSDDEIEASIKGQLVASPVPGTASIAVYSRQGVVVLTGVVPRGSNAGITAVNIARATSGVSRVETFFVSSRPSEANDLEIEGKVKAAFVADPNLLEQRVSVAVYGGNVVLIGVVADPSHLEEFVDDARSVDGVTSVRSYIQLVNSQQ